MLHKIVFITEIMKTKFKQEICHLNIGNVVTNVHYELFNSYQKRH
jgi:hypothetical protein